MRAKRSKQYRKLMHQYALHFNFREPYQVLVDAAIIQAAARFKMRLGTMLENTLHGSIKPMITQCCIRHLYDLEVDENDPASKNLKEECITVAKQAERRRCGHHELDEPLSALECMESVVDPKASSTNKHRYVVATQDPTTRQKMRQIPGVPLVYINRSVMILEPMAEKTAELRTREEKGKMRAGLKSSRPEASLKRRRDESRDEEQRTAEDGVLQQEPPLKKLKKVKGPRGPNPLSVKKAKKEKPTANKDGEEGYVARNMSQPEPPAEDRPEGFTFDGESKASAEGPAKRKRKRQRGQKEADFEAVAVVADEEKQ